MAMHSRQWETHAGIRCAWKSKRAPHSTSVVAHRVSAHTHAATARSDPAALTAAETRNCSNPLRITQRPIDRDPHSTSG